jgi:hypothetical protein
LVNNTIVLDESFSPSAPFALPVLELASFDLAAVVVLPVPDFAAPEDAKEVMESGRT